MLGVEQAAILQSQPVFVVGGILDLVKTVGNMGGGFNPPGIPIPGGKGGKPTIPGGEPEPGVRGGPSGTPEDPINIKVPTDTPKRPEGGGILDSVLKILRGLAGAAPTLGRLGGPLAVATGISSGGEIQPG